MNSLPIEIYNNLFLYLDLRQKIQCMLVCRRWANVIRSNCLLHTVDIGNINALKHFLGLMHREPDRTLQIKHLIINNDYIDYFPSSHLYNLFPNLKSICLKQAPHGYGHHNIVFPESSKEIKDQPNQIVDIIDYGDCEFTWRLLSSGVCPQLTSLTLDMEDSHRTTLHIICVLENTPNLRTLTMHNPILTLSDLDRLHNYLSRLESLTMKYLKLYKYKKNDTIPITVIPSPSVKTLSLSVLGMGSEQERLLLEYVRKKYNCLKSLALRDSYIMEFKRSAKLWLLQLEYEDTSDEDDDDEFIYGEDNLEIIEDTEAGDMSIIPRWIPFIQYYGNRLKKLELASVKDEPDLFIKMDECGCQLQSLSVYNVGETPILEMIGLSQQHRYIQELALNNIDYSDISFDLFHRMILLTKLEITFASTQYSALIDFNHLLDSCSNGLACLTFGNVELEFDDDVEQQYALTKLELDSFDVPDEFGLFLSHHFQNLRYLTLNGRTPLCMSLDLPKLHLACFNLKTPTSNNTLYFSVVTLASKQNRSYAVNYKRENCVFLDSLTETYGVSVCTSVPRTCLDLSNSNQSFVLVCASVQNVIVNNFLAC